MAFTLLLILLLFKYDLTGAKSEKVPDTPPVGSARSRQSVALDSRDLVAPPREAMVWWPVQRVADRHGTGDDRPEEGGR